MSENFECMFGVFLWGINFQLLVENMADDEKKEAGDKNDPRRLHSFPLIRVSDLFSFIA